MELWKRPVSLEFPTIWHTFEGRNVGINGFRRTFWVQDLTEEYKESVLHHMSTGFITEATLYAYGRVADDPESVQGIQDLLKDKFKQKVSLICLTSDENGTTKFVGYNVLYVLQKGESVTHYKGEALNNVEAVFHDIYGKRDLYSELNVDKYLRGFGLYVLPDYRGEGIGIEILKARTSLCRAMGIKVSITTFSTKGGQNSAEKAGFKDFLVYPYEDIKKLNPMYEFPGIENYCIKTLRLMYVRY